MLIHHGARLYSASDLVNFMGCVHATALDVGALAASVKFPEADAQTKLLQDKGIEHERAFLERLRAQGRSIVEVTSEGSLEARAALTLEAMRAGVDVVYQGALLAPPWHGYSDFLLKVDGVPSALGDFAYDVADTKLSRSAKPKHVLQLCVYGHLLMAVQGVPPPSFHVALGTGEVVSLQAPRCAITSTPRAGGSAPSRALRPTRPPRNRAVTACTAGGVRSATPCGKPLNTSASWPA
jgi:uncharacterized protein